MSTVFLGDTFSLDEPQYLGRSIANRSLVRALFMCDQVEKVVTIGNPATWERLGLPDTLARKLVILASVDALLTTFEKQEISAIFCSTFGKKYAQLIHFRNLNQLTCPVFGVTHTLSYQDEVGAIYRLFCAGARTQDGILCTSDCAVDVVTRLLSNVRETLSFKTQGPSLIKFPLAYEAGDTKAGHSKSDSYFQVLFMGRLCWNTKADVLVIPRIVECLPTKHKIRFVIAGAAEDPDYMQLLSKQCANAGIRLLRDLSDEDRNNLYRDSHVMFSPSDNYQETFGLTVIEARHHGCVPVVSDFDGYRNLVRDGEDGLLLKTYAARIPERLFNAQILMPDKIYHGWWAAGVSIDPYAAAAALYELSTDREHWSAMSARCLETASEYDLAATAKRFGTLLENVESQQDENDVETNSRPDNPFHIDYSDVFRTHPTAFWSDQQLSLTLAGKQFKAAPDANRVPQLNLFSGTVTLAQISSLLADVIEVAEVAELLAAAHEPITLSLALKNGLIRVVS